MRISADQRVQNEQRVRAAMDRLLRGDVPTGGRCDVKTLAVESGLDRASFYGARPYARLREEFEARLQQAARAGQPLDPRGAQVSKLKAELVVFNQRLARRDQTIVELTDFKTEALSRLAAQHDEITHLRATLADFGNIRRLPVPTGADGT
ncbi:MAG: hypothetical protein ACYCV5_03955 [Acidimicrobiales bacterium]